MHREGEREGAVYVSRRPRLLTASLTEAARLYPESMSVELDLEATSTATMELAEDDANVQMHDFVEVYTPRGSAGIFRVTNIADTKRGSRTVTLMHAIDTLADGIWAAQEDYSGTVAGFLTSLLAWQPVVRWQLGTVAGGTAAWKKAGINYDRLSELLEEFRQERFGYYFSYDFTTTPWTLNVMAQGATVTSEFRLDRNVENCEITRDDGEMCNRLYLSVNEKLKTYDVTVNHENVAVFENTASQAIYGVVEKTADIDLADVPSASAWAADFLAQRAHPAVAIVIDGYALQAVTGETWDEARLGEMARVALPDYAEALEERVVTITYPDLLFAPGVIERVTVQLANHTAKFSETISQIRDQTRKTGRAGRASGRGGASAAEVENWAMVVTKHGTIMEDTALEQMWQSGIELDAQSGVRIWSLAQGFVSQHASITVNSNKIALVVEGDGANAHIKAASIVASINNSGSLVTIDADKVSIDAQTTVKSVLTGAARVTSFQTTNFNQSSGGRLYLKGTHCNWSAVTYVTGFNPDGVTLRTETKYFLLPEAE